MTPAEYIDARDPGLYAANVTRIPTLITLATAKTSASFFKADYTEAIGLRVLHWLAKQAQDSEGNSGVVTGVTTGRESIQFGQPSNDDDLSRTGYGKELQTLTRGHGGGIALFSGRSRR